MSVWIFIPIILVAGAVWLFVLVLIVFLIVADAYGDEHPFRTFIQWLKGEW